MYVYVALLFTLIMSLPPPPPGPFLHWEGTVRISQPFFKLVEKHCVYMIKNRKIGLEMIINNCVEI